MGRLGEILLLTRSPDADVGPAPHFGEIIRNTGDLGFRREFRDSVRYHPSALTGKDIPLHPKSSNQIGHFLTAVDIGFSVETIKRSAHIRPALFPVAKAAETKAIRAIVGHEKLPDGGFSTEKQIEAATSDDVENFLKDRLDEINISASGTGNSYQDLYLSRVGYVFGQRVASNYFASNQEAAEWLKLVLTQADLSKIGPKHKFYKDVQWIQKLLQQFKKTQGKPGTVVPDKSNLPSDSRMGRLEQDERLLHEDRRLG